MCSDISRYNIHEVTKFISRYNEDRNADLFAEQRELANNAVRKIKGDKRPALAAANKTEASASKQTAAAAATASFGDDDDDDEEEVVEVKKSGWSSWLPGGGSSSSKPAAPASTTPGMTKGGLPSN